MSLSTSESSENVAFLTRFLADRQKAIARGWVPSEANRVIFDAIRRLHAIGESDLAMKLLDTDEIEDEELAAIVAKAEASKQ